MADRFFRKRISSILLAFLLFLLQGTSSFAAPGTAQEAPDEASLERKALPVESNSWESWPKGPAISAQAAILMEANTGAILYSKNIHEKLYPASTTKMLTCLVAVENSTLNEPVTFSYGAVSAVPPDGSNMGIDPGEVLPMEECLYGIMVASANEVASAVGEHIAGSIPAFVDMLNEKAKELGCTETHFTNANGLFDENHYTSAHDLAVIARAFFENDILKRVGNTKSYHFQATATQPDDFYKTNKHNLINGSINYEGIIGGKTGYTGESRQTLVTGCERGGLRLICVVLMEESPLQFEDTVELFDYGFQNFMRMNVAEADTAYSVKSSNFFQVGQDIFAGNSKPLLEIPADQYLIVPNLAGYDDLASDFSYTPGMGTQIAEITYKYKNQPVGRACVLLNLHDHSSESFSPMEEGGILYQENTIFLNIKLILGVTAILAGLFISVSLLYSILYNRQDLRHDRRRRKEMRREQIKQRRIRFKNRKRSSARRRF